MAPRLGASATTDSRGNDRDEVHYRARATGADGSRHALLLVNISAGGLMARCETPFAVDDRLRVELPLLGTVDAQVRWALGGRIGCQFDQIVAPPAYYALLAALSRR